MALSEEEIKLIDDEEARFRKTVDSLCRELPEVQQAKIFANQAARELTSKITTEWNPEERQPLVSDEAVAHRIVDIRQQSDQDLLELIEEPYFGRVVTSEDDGSEVDFLIGKKSNIDSGIVDWRNGPISSLYFNYQQGEEFLEVINDRERSGRIKIRRSYKVHDGQIVEIDTPDGVYSRGENGWGKLDLDMAIAAHRSRGLHSEEKTLPNILSLITKEQFQTITSDPEIPVLIQGSAGSGKTTVALHRLAWLLGGGQQGARAKNTRVMMMNKALQMYVASTLPSMGINDVETTTFNRWALSVIRGATGQNPNIKFLNLPSFVEEIKFSQEILAAISGYVEKQTQEVNLEIGERFYSHPALLKKWRETGENAPLPRLRDFIHDVESSKLQDNEKRLQTAFLQTKCSAMQDYIGDIYRILGDPEFLARYLKPHEKRVSELQYLKRLCEKNRDKKILDYFDMSLIVRNIQLKNGGIPDKAGRVGYLDHLVIDEVQDFGPVEFAVMRDAVASPSHVTVVGDVAQKILTSRKFLGWEEITRQLGQDNESLIQLEVSFRCTVPIMKLARRVEGSQKPVHGRKGSPPKWHRAKNRDDVLETLTEWVANIRAEDPLALVAVICRYPRQAMELKEELKDMIADGLRLGHRSQFSFGPGVIVTNVHQVKGLEFDAVCLVEPSEKDYPKHRSENRNLLYVAITRAQEEILLIGQEPYSKFLAE